MVRVPGAALRRVTTGLAVAGMAARRRPPAPGSVRTREGAASADAQGADSPLPFPAAAIGLVVLPVSVHAFALGQLAPFRDRGGEARRWRAAGAPLKL
jgi:hypothetical protein